MTGARQYLHDFIAAEWRDEYGLFEAEHIEAAVDAWMNDDDNSKHRFDVIRQVQPAARSVLDLGCGCGTAFYYGMRQGYDMHGVDPNPAKHVFNAMKARERDYPEKWQDRIVDGRGESLPYEDDRFDFVTTYQVLEHVQDLDRVVAEMLRVTRPGGAIHIACPDYRCTWEPHYRLPWLPLLPRPIARLYLRALGRPTRGLEAIVYVTRRRLERSLRRAQHGRPSLSIHVIDRNRERFSAAIARLGIPQLDCAAGYALYRARQQWRDRFRVELGVDLVVRVLAK